MTSEFECWQYIQINGCHGSADQQLVVKPQLVSNTLILREIGGATVSMLPVDKIVDAVVLVAFVD